MRYNNSITDFFKSPKWGMNILLGAVTLLIPVVGQLVINGWHITLFWARGDDEDPADYPPFDFANFAKYLERGVWPFLVRLVASFVLIPVVMVLFWLMFAGLLTSHPGHGNAGVFPAVFFISMFLIYPVFMIAFNGLLIPLLVRATITQDFAQSFNFQFMRSFLALVWKELLVTMLFICCTGLCLVVIAVCTCYIGGFLLAPVAIFSWHHLQKQLYQTYLTRGGEVVPRSPGLFDLPPPLPR